MMNFRPTLLVILLCVPPVIHAQQQEETNKMLARRFYEQLWFSNNPAVVDELFAPTYIATDVGDRKGVTEPAEEQKRIAAFFWNNGTMSGKIDYQIADGDLVATRWQWEFTPTTWYTKTFDKAAKTLGGRRTIPIINVFRFKDGKIVELWNHRHDVDTGVTNVKYFVQGFLVATVPFALITFLLWRKLRKQKRLLRTAVAA